MKKQIFFIFFPIIIGCVSTVDFYEKGHRALVRNDYEQAIVNYQRFLETNPKDERKIKAEIEVGKAYLNSGKRYYEQGNYQMAEKLFYSANTEEGDNWIAKCKLKLAEMDYSKAQYEKSIERLNLITKAYCSSEVYSLALVLKIKSLHKLNREQECLEVCRELVKVYRLKLPEEIKTILDEIAMHYIDKGDDLLNEGKFKEAIQTWSEFDLIPTSYKTKLETNKENAYLMWALTYKNQGDYEQAIDVLQGAQRKGITSAKIEQSLSSNRFLLSVKKGDLAYENREWVEARDYYEKALEYNPNSRRIKQKLAQIAKKLKFGTVYDFENGILVRTSGYHLKRSWWIKQGEYAGKFARQYNSPEGEGAIVSFISEFSSKNSIILSFTILMVPGYFSTYQDVLDLLSFLADATDGNIPIKNVSRFITNSISANKTRTKWFGNFMIEVTPPAVGRVLTVTVK